MHSFETRHVVLAGTLVVFIGVHSYAAPACVPGVTLFGDYDRRGDVASFDVRAMRACLGGPDRRVGPPSPFRSDLCLAAFDADSDQDIDLDDLRKFQLAYGGRCVGFADCPLGTHLEHVGGERGISNPDTFQPEDADAKQYRCIADGDCLDRTCAGHGACSLRGGRAVCACRPGYAGDDCSTCAVGYERDERTTECILGRLCRERYCSGQGDCIERGSEILCECDRDASGRFCEEGGGGLALRPPTYIEISGTNASVERNQSRMLCAKLFGGGNIDQNLTWSLDGPGLFTTLPNNCILFVSPPPDDGDMAAMTRIRACAQSFPDQCADRFLTIDPPGGIHSTGQAHKVLEPFDHVIRRYMLDRCVGGAIFGVSLFGKPIMVRGFGSLSGAPTNDPAYLASCSDTFNVSNAVPGYTLPGPTQVQPNSAFRIGSISKCVGAAMLRKAVKANILSGGNPADDDDEVEGLVLCENTEMLPPEVVDVMCLGAPPPAPLSTVSGLSPNCDDETPCPYGGECVPNDPKGGVGVCTDCPPGFAGTDCSRNTTHCASLASHVDARWDDVTLGHLMGHRSGLPRSVPDAGTVILPRLFQLRGLMTESDWQDQEDLLTSEEGFPSGTFAAEFPNFDDAKDDIGENGYFVPRLTLAEAILARLGSCLLYTPGGTIPEGLNSYSNTAYAFIGGIIETITGMPISGRTGKPAEHEGSYLEQFAEQQLGLPLPDQGTPYGIFSSGGVFRLRPANTPVFRHWDDDQQTYYPLYGDDKRPHCEWSSNDCRFTDWQNNDPRHDWDFVERGSLPAFSGGGSGGTGTEGGFYTEAEVFLRFMAKYWVGGESDSNNDPLYGESRCPDGDCIWNQFIGHNGSLDGVWAEARQLGGMVDGGVNCSATNPCPIYTACAGTAQYHQAQSICLGLNDNGIGRCYVRNEYYIPPLHPITGLPTGDFTNLECHSCRLPLGVDLFIAFNQDADKKCVEAEALGEDNPFYYSCNSAYSMSVAYLYHAACQVDWPANPFVLWPQVTRSGGSTMSPEFKGGP